MSDMAQPASNVETAVLKNQTSVTIAENEIAEETTVRPTDLPGSPIIYTIPELANKPDLLHGVVIFINEVFWIEEKSYCSDTPRFPKDEDLLEQFGPDALCAVIFCGSRVIATASILPWREPKGSVADEAFRMTRHADYCLVEAGHSYQIGGVATAGDPAFRRKGLATQCIDSLQQAVFAQNGNLEFLIWLHTVEHQNGAYWRRRGFEEVCVEWKPKGYWGVLEPFQYTTLVKKVRSKDSEVKIESQR